MSEQGAALQKYNQELVKCIEKIKSKRYELACEMRKEEDAKNKLEEEISALRKKHDAVTASLNKKIALMQSYDATVKESEEAYMKILESSEVLLSKVRRETEILEETSE